VVVLGAFGGRFDQEMQNMSQLYRWTPVFRQLIMVSEHCLACLVGAGRTVLRPAWPWEGPVCGLIPLGRPVASLTTHGLHWDVADWPTAMDGNVSSSNRVEGWGGNDDKDKGAAITGRTNTTEAEVTIVTSDPIVWTITINVDSLEEPAA
jgi:thiamine pyrophosphokinase